MLRQTGCLMALAAAGVATVLTTAAPSPATAATTTSATCVDGGGVRWQVTAIWGGVYRASDGVSRVTLDYVGWTTVAGIVPTDSVVRTYNGSGTLYQRQPWTGSFDYRSGTAFKVRNPANPASSAGKVKVTATLGVDGDGYGDCTVSFTQPGTAPSPTPTPTTTAPVTPTPTSTPTSGSVSDRYEADVITATNGERAAQGLAAVAAEACVDRYAEAQAGRMAGENRMYHQDLGPILSECRLSSVGENVAFGYPDGKAVTAGWMGSTGHRANILNSSYRLIGVGAAQNAEGRWYVAQVFGAAR